MNVYIYTAVSLMLQPNQVKMSEMKGKQFIKQTVQTELLTSCCWDPSGVDLCRSCACCLSLNGILGVSVLGSRLLSVSTTLSASPSMTPLSPEGRDFLEMSRFLRSLALCTLTSCGSLCLFPSASGGGVSDDS